MEKWSWCWGQKHPVMIIRVSTRRCRSRNAQNIRNPLVFLRKTALFSCFWVNQVLEQTREQAPVSAQYLLTLSSWSWMWYYKDCTRESPQNLDWYRQCKETDRKGKLKKKAVRQGLRVSTIEYGKPWKEDRTHGTRALRLLRIWTDITAAS